MLFFILLSLASAQGVYKKGSQYVHDNQDDAQAACVGLDLSLCSSEQLYTVVYSSNAAADYPEGGPTLCYTGWTSTGDEGWWNNDASTCANTLGWNSWTPSDGRIGAHCCDSNVPATTPQECKDVECSNGFIRLDNYLDIYCVDGNCNDAQCCMPWEPADRYSTQPSQYEYAYSSGEQAHAACATANADWQLCTREQVEGLAADGESICTSGWWRDGEEFGRGWYVSQEDADAGACEGGDAGYRDWVNGIGTGTAHCCTESYTKNAYYGLVAAGYTNDLAGAQDYCATQSYTNTVCTELQLESVAKTEERSICASGFYRSDNSENAVEQIGWYQMDATCSDGTTGLITWAHEEPVAHCCAPYVLEVEVELGQWGTAGSNYGEGYSDPAAAESDCLAMGYDGMCSQGQVVTIGTNLQRDLCIVGWSVNADGQAVAGYWNNPENPLSGCGEANTWNDDWIPSTPVGFCCMAGLEAADVAADTAIVYFNSDWDYSYKTQDEGQAKCQETAGFNLCSYDQLYTIATTEVSVDDQGNTQTAPDICRLGWINDPSLTVGWYQGSVGAGCTQIGWQTFQMPANGAGVHCCTDFAAQSTGSTEAPTYPAFAKFEGGYTLYNMGEAKAACTAMHSDYSLCSAAQVVEVAVEGAPGDDTFSAVDRQTNLCYTSWVDTDQAICPTPQVVGWFQIDDGCGSDPWTWNTYAPLEEGTGFMVAGALCCAPSVVTTKVWDDELGCGPELTLQPTLSPVVMDEEYFPLETDIITGLGDIGVDASMLYIKDNQYYYSADNGVSGYDSTCVGASDNPNAGCDNSNLVCAGVLRNVYGTLEQQGVLLGQALAETSKLHSNCPPATCDAYDGYSPEDFEALVSYCSYNGCYYMNGMETCVCDASSTNVAADLENLWDNVFELSECPDPRTFDEIMDDQLWITNSMVTDLETQINSIPDVNSQLVNAQAELQAIWDEWSLEITNSINAAATTAEQDGNTELVNELNDILTSLSSLSG